MFTSDIASLLNWIEALGYMAAGLVITTYSMKTMIPLRLTSIGASILFIVYGYLVPSYPQLFLHGIILPLNVIRLRQMMNLIQQVKSSADSDLSMEWLRPFSSRRSYEKGEVVFRKNDPADTMYYTLSGKYLLEEIAIEINPGQVVGEIGMVAPDNSRTQTFKCIETGELLTLSYERAKEMYFQNPQFGFYFLKLITKRLIANNAALTERLEKRSTSSRQRK